MISNADYNRVSIFLKCHEFAFFISGPARGTFDYLNDYSDADKVKMMESLIRYTKTLQDRVEVSRCVPVPKAVHLALVCLLILMCNCPLQFPYFLMYTLVFMLKS